MQGVTDLEFKVI